jgi:hypothetical protein
VSSFLFLFFHHSIIPIFKHFNIPSIGHRLYRSSSPKVPCGVRGRKRLSAIIRVSSVAKSTDAGEAAFRVVGVARSQMKRGCARCRLASTTGLTMRYGNG